MLGKECNAPLPRLEVARLDVQRAEAQEARDDLSWSDGLSSCNQPA